MKKILLALAISTFALTSYAEPTTKRVCTDVKGKDGKVVKNKDGSSKQTCRTIKIHKKYDGTKVPDKAPAKPTTKPSDKK
jgi:hypothetical protein